MKIGEVLNGVYDDEIGWRPATGRIKPVHVANGLVRAVCREYYDISAIVEFLVWWKEGKVPDEERSFKRMVVENPRRTFACFEHHPLEFEKARKYALGLLNADDGLYPSAEHSALTLTCRNMASPFHGDYHLGEFGASLLRSGDGPLEKVLLKALDVTRPDDPLTTIVWPLLPSDSKVVHGADGMSRALRKRQHQACLRELQGAARRLARHGEHQGNRLRTLEHIVHFVCMATHAHAHAISAGGDLAARTPLLLALSGEKRSPIAIASERALALMHRRLEEALIEYEAARLRSGKPLAEGEEELELSTDRRTVRKVLNQILTAGRKAEKPGEEIINARMAHFDEAKRLRGKADAAWLMAYTLVRSYVHEYESGGPRSFLQGLARKIGLLYPHFAGNSRDKRIRPSTAILDLLVRACVPARELIPLDEFLGRLWSTFGLVVGGRRGEDSDADLLKRHGLEQDPSLLKRNTNALVDLLADMGLARRFADNVTFIGDGYAA